MKKVSRQQMYNTISLAMREKKVLCVSKDSVRTGMELYIPGLPGPVVVRKITITDCGVRLHTDVGSFEFGKGDSYGIVRTTSN